MICNVYRVEGDTQREALKAQRKFLRSQNWKGHYIRSTPFIETRDNRVAIELFFITWPQHKEELDYDLPSIR